MFRISLEKTLDSVTELYRITVIVSRAWLRHVGGHYTRKAWFMFSPSHGVMVVISLFYHSQGVMYYLFILFEYYYLLISGNSFGCWVLLLHK
nr:hypothetical protein CFP56_17164 [Quercus suber]